MKVYRAAEVAYSSTHSLALQQVQVTGKGKVHLRTGHEVPEGE